MRIELHDIPLREALHYLGWRGTPLDEQVLGQMKMDSAKQYLVFDTANLRECAISLAGIEVAGGVFND